MGFFGKLKAKSETTASGQSGTANVALLDGALDTLDCVMRTMGEYDIELEDEDPRFHDLCKQYARHVVNGAGIVDEGIGDSADGSRNWPKVRRFYIDRRQKECEFVNERSRNYRILVEDLVVGLRSIATREELTESSVKQSLKEVQIATDSGDIRTIRSALDTTISTVVSAFNEQRRIFESQISQANTRMLSLREDLATAREDLKRDVLTDTFNRSAFDIALQQSVALNFILQQPLTVVMIDLDNFKRVNDTFGHAAGDDVLRAVADCLSRCFVRRSDMVARYGGEEFCLMLGDVNEKAAEPLIQRFLKMVEDTVKIPYADDSEKVTCSAGLTELLPTDTVESVLQRADRALYRAKNSGRNKVCVGSGLNGSPEPTPAPADDLQAKTG